MFKYCVLIRLDGFSWLGWKLRITNENGLIHQIIGPFQVIKWIFFHGNTIKISRTTHCEKGDECLLKTLDITMQSIEVCCFCLEAYHLKDMYFNFNWFSMNCHLIKLFILNFICNIFCYIFYACWFRYYFVIIAGNGYY